jgi:hypothetical protein
VSEWVSEWGSERVSVFISCCSFRSVADPFSAGRGFGMGVVTYEDLRLEVRLLLALVLLEDWVGGGGGGGGGGGAPVQ